MLFIFPSIHSFLYHLCWDFLNTEIFTIKLWVDLHIVNPHGNFFTVTLLGPGAALDRTVCIFFLMYFVTDIHAPCFPDFLPSLLANSFLRVAGSSCWSTYLQAFSYSHEQSLDHSFYLHTLPL